MAFFVKNLTKISHITNNYNPSFIRAVVVVAAVIISVGEDGVLVN